jgi:hypothetical protein
VEDNGLEHTRVFPEKPEVLQTRVLNPTRADLESIETVFQLLPKLDSEQLQTLATIARQFAPKNAETMRADNAFS